MILFTSHKLCYALAYTDQIAYLTMTLYNINRQIYCLSLASNVLTPGFGSKSTPKTGTKSELQTSATTILQNLFSDPKIQQLIGKWDIVWGPVVFQHHGDKIKSKVADNVMFMAAKGNDSGEPDCYVISMAGTNPISLYDIIEDLYVNETKPWNNGQPWNADSNETSDIRVSAGISLGLKALCEMQSNHKSLIEYLKELMIGASKPISITFTGMSLGGSLSPTLALSLSDRRSEWDPQEQATLSVLPIAGFPPGNAMFAAHYDQNLSATTDRIWNQLDLIPHWWQQDLLDQARSMYEPYLHPNLLINLLIDTLKLWSKDGNYQQFCSQIPGFSLRYNRVISNYLEHLDISEISTFLAKVILPHLGFERPKQESIGEVAEIIKTAIDDLIDYSPSNKILSEEKINKTEVKPDIEKIIVKLQQEKSPLAHNWLRNKLDEIFSSGWTDVIKYMGQVGYQHAVANMDYLNISEFDEIFKNGQELNSVNYPQLSGVKSKPKRIKVSYYYDL